MLDGKNKRIRRKARSITEKKEKSTQKTVEFIFDAPNAREVFVSGEFNNWDTRSLPMKKDKKGIWKMKIKLPPGRYEHKFFADNVWVESLPGVEQVSNPLGTRNFIAWVR